MESSQHPTLVRSAVVEWLNRIEVGGAYVDEFGEEADLEGDARARRQATEYVAGITRWRRWLDFLLADFYRGRYDSMEPLLRQILRLGLYDLLFLDTPPHAALNEAVELAKRKVRPGAAGLVNGMLRNLHRQRKSLPEPSTGDAAEDLAIAHSHPTWMVRRWLGRYGREETEALLQWNNARPTYGLRVNGLRKEKADIEARLKEEDVSWERSAYFSDFLRLHRLQTVIRGGWIEKGWCAVQDESAGGVVRLLDPRPGEHVLDACAAPGGKTIYAAERMRDQGLIRAVDVDEQRLVRLRENAARHELRIVEIEAADLRTIARREEQPQADRVLVDVPCTGLGVLSKRADLRWRREPGDLEELPRLQADLLEAASRLVKPDGILVYSTCTTEPEENEKVVQAFLKAHPSFSVEAASDFVSPELVTPGGFYATRPQRHRMDGAFGVRLRRAS